MEGKRPITHSWRNAPAASAAFDKQYLKGLAYYGIIRVQPLNDTTENGKTLNTPNRSLGRDLLQTSSAREVDSWSLDEALFYLTYPQRDPFTLRDACEGMQIFGAIGSGKTSGSGATLARAFLYAGFGGLVCCAKPEERRLWQQYAAETGRTKDLVIVGAAARRGDVPPWRFNFLAYELTRRGAGGGETENVVNLLTSVVEIVENRQGQEGGDPFWQRATKELLRNAVDLLSLAGESLTLDAICRLIASAPMTAPQSDEWRNTSYCAACFIKAVAASKTSRQAHDLETTGRYWLQSFATLNDRTRSSIIATFTSIADMLLRGLARELLGTDTNIIPEVTFRKGAVIVLDFSIQEYREMGRIVQGVWKRMFQEALLRRDVQAHPRPVFLWADEAQNFVSPFDYEYQATARSARACTVYLTQNISNYHAKLGASAKAQADALLGLFGAKIFHAQSDYATNQFAADLIGKHWTERRNRGTSAGESGSSFNAGSSDSLEYKVEPAAFTTLRKGGPANDRQVDGVIFQSGRIWEATGETFLPVTFVQQ